MTTTNFEFYEGTASEHRGPEITVRRSGQLVLTAAAAELLGEGVRNVQIGGEGKRGEKHRGPSSLGPRWRGESARRPACRQSRNSCLRPGRRSCLRRSGCR